MTIKAVAFDMDGLMFDTEDTYWKAASALLARRGEVYTKELCDAVTGRAAKFTFELFKETFGFPETWQELQTESEDLFLEFLDEGYSTMPGLYELLEHLEQRNIPKGICTSSAYRVVSEVLHRKDMTRRFDFVLTAEDVSHAKPNPDIYLKAASRFGIAPSEMLVLEDSVAGCQAAHQSGAVCIAVRAKHNAHFVFAESQKIATSLDNPLIMDWVRSVPFDQ
jgi:HAD superfamily hydrolase (TIGR01509 family)